MTTHRRICALALLVCTLGFAPSRAEGAMISFTTLVDWTTAVGAFNIETFNGFAVDTSFQNVNVALNGMTVTGTTGLNGALTQKIDAPPLFPDYFVDSTNFLYGDVRTTTDLSEFVRFDFTSPLTAWSAETRGLGDQPTTTISVYNASNVLLGSIPTFSPTSATLGFYGFQLTGGDQAAYLTITSATGANDLFGLDNIRFPAAPQTAAPVPEPATVALFASGLAAIALLRRRRS